MKSRIALGLVLAGSLVATGADAIDKVKNVNLSPSQFAATPVIKVVNDGHDFTAVQGSTTYSAIGSGECKGANKVQSANFGLGEPNLSGGFFEFSPNSYASNAVGGTGGKSISGGVTTDVPASKAHFGGVGVFTDPVQMCNVAKDGMVQNGQAGWDVLKNGFEIQTTKRISYAIRCQFNNPVGQYADLVYWEKKTIEVPAVVQCEGNPSVQGPSAGIPTQLVTPFQIMEAELDVEDEVEGYCVKGFDFPVGLKIKSNGMPGDASFRMAKDGNWGGITNLHFTAQDTTFEHEVMVHVPPADMGADGELNQFQSNPGLSNGPIDGFASNGPKVHELKLAILEPHAKVWDTKSVKIKCGGPTLNPAIGKLPGGLQIEPKTPTAPLQPGFQAAVKGAKIQPAKRGLAKATSAKIAPAEAKGAMIAPADEQGAKIAPSRLMNMEIQKPSATPEEPARRGLKSRRSRR